MLHNRSRIKRRGFRFKGYKEVAVILLILTPVIYFGNQAAGQERGKFVSPLPDAAYATTIKTYPVVSGTPHNAIRDEIDQVFGSDAPKAYKLLSCENSSLNPNAVNTAGNYPVGSRDIGIFQVNEFWQKVNAKFLFDPTINIQIAHKIYTDSGNNFSMWSCGKRMKI